MKIELLNIENDMVVPGIDCYTVPELKAILDVYDRETAIEIFTYLRFLYHPMSAYKNLPEKDKEEAILEKIRTKDWSTDDQYIIQASMEMKQLFISPTRQFFNDAKYALEKVGKHMRTATISDGRDGNFGTYSMNLTRLGKIQEDFKKLEKAVEDEESEDLRGGAEHSDI